MMLILTTFDEFKLSFEVFFRYST